MNAENITKLDIPPEIFVTLANAIWPPFIFAIFIGIPSAILYAFELGITIAKRNVFKSSFFKLFAIRAFWSLIGLIGNFLYSRFGRIGWFLPIYLMLPQVLLTFFYFLIVYSYSVENLSTIVLLLNRLTSLLYPVNYEKFWQKRMSLIIAAISLLPLILTGHSLLSDRYVRIQADNVTFTVDNRPKPQSGEWNDSFIAACSSMIFSLVCLLLNVGIIIAYRTNSKRTNRQSGSGLGDANTKIMERKLTIYTIATFIAQFIYAAYMLFLYIAVVNVFGFGLNTWQTFFLAVFNQYAWINDFSTIVIPSWLMLWASNLMQTQLKGIIPFMNKSNLQTSGVPKIAWSGSPNLTK